MTPTPSYMDDEGMDEYYAKIQEVQNLERALHNAEAELEILRKQMYGIPLTDKPNSKET